MMNNTTSQTADVYSYVAPFTCHPGEIVVLCLICFLILLGNSLVILAYMKGSRRLKTGTNYFVINLAVSDIMVGCISLPFWIVVRLDLVSQHNPAYKYLISLDVFFGATSIYCLTAISLERMFAVKYPTIHYNSKDGPYYVTIAVTWLFGIAMLAFKFIFGSGAEQEKKYTIFILVMAFLLPLTIIVGCYAVIFYTARTMFVATNQEGNLSRDIQVAKTISVIIGLFVFCWSPFFIINMVYYYGTKANSDYVESPEAMWLITLTKVLHYSNSMMNFFVYAVRSPDFKEAFKAMLCSNCSRMKIRDRLRALSNSRHLSMKRKESVNNQGLLPPPKRFNKMPKTESNYSMVTIKTTDSMTLLEDSKTLDNNNDILT